MNNQGNIVLLETCVSPQKENGFTPIANEVLDALCKAYIPARERQCLDFIIRKTYGYGQTSDRISLSQFVSGTGLKKRTVRDSLNSLEQKRLIDIQPGDFKTPKNYSFNKHYDQWSVQRNPHSAEQPAQGVRKNTSFGVRNNPHHKRNIKKVLKKGAKNILGEFKNNSQIPKNYTSSDYHTDYAFKKGFSLETSKRMFEKFKAHHQAKGSKFKSWRAAWRTWVLNQIEYHGIEQPTVSGADLSPEEQIQEFLS